MCLECNDNKTNEDVDHEEGDDDEIDEVVEEDNRSIVLLGSCPTDQQLDFFLIATRTFKFSTFCLRKKINLDAGLHITRILKRGRSFNLKKIFLIF